MKTNPFKNLLKTLPLIAAVLLSVAGFGQSKIDQSSYASLAGVSKTSTYRWEGIPVTEEENNSNEVVTISPPLPCMTLSISVVNESCSGYRNDTVFISVSGSEAPYFYNILNYNEHATSNSSSHNFISILPGTYSVQVTSGDGCIATQTMVIGSTNLSPTITISGTQTLCPGQTTTLTASGASTYTWTTYEGITTIATSTSASIAAGYTADVNYGIKAMGTNGCISNSGFSLTYLPAGIGISVATAIICNGGSTTLNAGGGTSYTWSPGGSTSPSIVVSPTVTTTYTVIGSGVCFTNISATTTVTVNPNLMPTISISGTQTVCSQQSYTYTASGASTYTWNVNGDINNPLVINPIGNFVHAGATNVLSVTGTGADGCVNTGTLNITNQGPVVSIGSSLSIKDVCSGTSFTINASVPSGATYTWTPSLSSLNPVVTPNDTTTYYLNVSNSFCTELDSFVVFVIPTPTINLISPVTLCTSSSYTFNPTISGALVHTIDGPQETVGYLWSPSTNLSSIYTATTVATGTSTGVYSLTVSNIIIIPTRSEEFATLVCQSTASTTLNVVPNPTISISGNLNICPGQTDTLIASGATTYTWSQGTESSSLIVGVDGYSRQQASILYGSSQVYTVTGTDGNGCIATATVTVNDPVPTFTLNSSTNSDYIPTICSGSSYSLSAELGPGVTSYTWDPALSGLNPVVSPSEPTQYIFTVSNGTCTAQGQVNIRVFPTPTVSLASSITICANNCYTLTPIAVEISESVSKGYEDFLSQATFSWSPSNGLSSTNTFSTIACPDSSTTYTFTDSDFFYPNYVLLNGVVVRDTLFCQDTASVHINVIQNPPVPVINYHSICDSNYTTLNIPGSSSTYTYTWNGPCYTGTGSSVNVNTVGIYTVHVTNSCGAVTTNTVSVLLIGNIAAGFQTYFLHSFIDDGGDGPPPLELSNFIHFENLSLGNNLIYQWTFGNGDTSIVINPNETFDTVGVFQVHLYDSDSLHCRDTASATVVLSGHNTALVIPNSFTPNNDNVDDVFAVNGIGVTNFKCQISDKWGNLLYQWNNLNGGWNGIASNGHVFAAGNYFYLLSYTDYNGLNQSRSGIITLK
jgi:gliding motility-associated-like protein